MLNLGQRKSTFVSPYCDSVEAQARPLSFAYLSAAERRVQRHLSAVGVRLQELVQGKLSAGWPLAHAWRPESGLVFAALRHGSARLAAMQLGLAHAATGQDVDIDISLTDRARVFFGGYLFEVSRRTQIYGSNHTVAINTDDGRSRFSFLHSSGKWNLNFDEAIHPTIVWSTVRESLSNRDDYVIRFSAEAPEVGDFWEECNAEHPDRHNIIEHGNAGEEIREAQRLVNECAPIFSRWNTELCAGTALYTNSDKNFMKSSSSLSRPGLIYIGTGAPVIACGEMLVHENSHQHFRLLELVDPLVDKGDCNLYYSPLKKEVRDITRIFLAAHAVLNILIYYKELRGNNVDLRNNGNKIRFYLQSFQVMSGHLLKSTGLTSAGSLFFDEMISIFEAAQLSSLA